jgi:hypothetical protein
MLLPIRLIPFVTVVQLFAAAAGHQTQTVAWPAALALRTETKGAVRYQEVGDDGAPAFAPQVGSLYVRKTAMPGGKIPKILIVAIEGD